MPLTPDPWSDSVVIALELLCGYTALFSRLVECPDAPIVCTRDAFFGSAYGWYRRTLKENRERIVDQTSSV